MSEQMISVQKKDIHDCVEELEFALESQVDRHCGVYICDGYINMSPEERWKEWGHSSTYETWEKPTLEGSNSGPLTAPRS
jgi:hypothetical protein